MTNPTEAPTAGMEAWVKVHAHSVHPQDGDGYGPNARIRIVSADDAEAKAREIDIQMQALQEKVTREHDGKLKWFYQACHETLRAQTAEKRADEADATISSLKDALAASEDRVETLEKALRYNIESCCGLTAIDPCPPCDVASSALSQAQTPATE